MWNHRGKGQDRQTNYQTEGQADSIGSRLCQQWWLPSLSSWGNLEFSACQSLDGHSGSPEIKLMEINGDHRYHHVRFPALIAVQVGVKNSFLTLMCPMSFEARFSDKIVICPCAELVTIYFEKIYRVAPILPSGISFQSVCLG